MCGYSLAEGQSCLRNHRSERVPVDSQVNDCLRIDRTKRVQKNRLVDYFLRMSRQFAGGSLGCLSLPPAEMDSLGARLARWS